MCRKHAKTQTHTQSDPQLQGKDTTVLQGPCQLCLGLVLGRAAPGMQNDHSRSTEGGGVVINAYPRKSACGDGSSPCSFLPSAEQGIL